MIYDNKRKIQRYITLLLSSSALLICLLAKATFSITTEAIVIYTFCRRKTNVLLYLSLLFLKRALNINIGRRVIAGRPRDHELISRNTCDATQTSLILVLTNLRRSIKLVLTRPCASVVQISIGISRKQKKYSFLLNVILKQVHSCFRPVKQRDIDTCKCRSVYTPVAGMLGLRIYKLFSDCFVEHFYYHF